MEAEYTEMLVTEDERTLIQRMRDGSDIPLAAVVKVIGQDPEAGTSRVRIGDVEFDVPNEVPVRQVGDLA